jgi:hypothetical protein
VKDLKLIRSEYFGNMQCDFYKHGKAVLMTRKQIGEALEYADPQKAIDKIHDRHKDRLNKFSVTPRLGVLTAKNTTPFFTPQKAFTKYAAGHNNPKLMHSSISYTTSWRDLEPVN